MTRLLVALAILAGSGVAHADGRCDALETAHETAPTVDTLDALAHCYEDAGQLASAWTAYRELVKAAPDPARREAALVRAQALAPRLPRLQITVAGRAPDDLVVKLNGLDVTTLVGVDTPIDLGTHELAARASGYQDYLRRFTIAREADIALLEIALVPLTGATTAPTITAPPLDPVTPGGRSDRRAKWGVACITAGVALLGSGVYFAITADSDLNRGVGIAGIGTGAVLGGVGVYLLRGTF